MNQKYLIKFSNAAANALFDAGKLVKEKRQNGFRVIRKEEKELVTDLDMFVQEFLKKRLTKELGPLVIMSEEMSKIDQGEGKYWSIDPIDGTHNLIAGLPFYGISAAYIENNKVLIGVISIPEKEIIYHASQSSGAYANKRKLSASTVTELNKSIVSYDNQFHLTDTMLLNYQKLVEESFTTRIHGSAAVDSCFVAEGILSARVYNATKLCDIAAGSILVEESGGVVTDFTGNPLNLNNLGDVIMSAKGIHSQLVSILKA